ncbi:MAG: hypothetical protein U0800_00720 [Isosphaeraceae bacterium]
MVGTTRRFGLGDLLILIFALAAGMQEARNLWRMQVEWQLRIEGPGSYWSSVTPPWLKVVAILTSIAIPMTLACLVFRLRRPRPPRRRLWVQPGAAAMLACALLFAARGVEVAGEIGRSSIKSVPPARVRIEDSTYLLHACRPLGLRVGVIPLAYNGRVWSFDAICLGIQFAEFSAPCGLTVAAVWLVLALSGRWRPEPSWIDRLGRLVGAAWIACAIAYSLPL